MKKPALIVMALALLLLNACKKNDDDKDTEKPVITLTTPKSGDVFYSGSNINVSVLFEDNKELSQYKIEIHDDFDGHTHLKTGSPAFSFVKVADLSGTGSAHHFSVPIPADVAAGPYHLIINALDKAGNEADFAEAEITIKNPADTIPPVINVTPSPAPVGGVIELNGTAKTITLAGTITDNEAVKSYEVLLLNKADKKNYVDIDGTTGTINETITFNDAWPDGDYLLVIEAYDLKNNRTDIEFDVKRTK